MSKRLRDKEAWIVTAKREQAYEKEHPELIEEKVAELKEIRKRKDMTRAEQAALKAYPKSTGVRELKGLSARPIFIEGYKQAEKDTIVIIESRLTELLGDAQPTPILRHELQDLIKRIKEE